MYNAHRFRADDDVGTDVNRVHGMHQNTVWTGIWKMKIFKRVYIVV